MCTLMRLIFFCFSVNHQCPQNRKDSIKFEKDIKHKIIWNIISLHMNVFCNDFSLPNFILLNNFKMWFQAIVSEAITLSKNGHHFEFVKYSKTQNCCCLIYCERFQSAVFWEIVCPIQKIFCLQKMAATLNFRIFDKNAKTQNCFYLLYCARKSSFIKKFNHSVSQWFWLLLNDTLQSEILCALAHFILVVSCCVYSI